MQSVEVAFAGGDAGKAGLAALSGVREVRRNGDKWRLYTDTPGQVIPAVVDCAGPASWTSPAWTPWDRAWKRYSSR